MRLTLVNMRLTNGNARDEGRLVCPGRRLPPGAGCCCRPAARELWLLAAAQHAGSQRIIRASDAEADPAGLPPSLTPLSSRLPPNKKSPDGGAILASAGAGVSMTNCALERNWGIAGGAIATTMDTGGDLTFEKVAFDGNHAGTTGGALRVNGNMLCTLCTFANNKAALGGAVDLAPATWAGFKDYAFIRNTGMRAGGLGGEAGAGLEGLGAEGA